MDEEREELLEHRLTQKVRDRVENDLKSRYMWLGIVALVFTSGTVTFIVNSLLLDSRIKLETARALQESTAKQLSRAAEQVSKFADDAEKIEQAMQAGASSAEKKFSELAYRADTLANQLTVFSEDNLHVSQELRKEVSSLSKIIRETLSDDTGNVDLQNQVENVLKSLVDSEQVIKNAETKAREFIVGYNDPLLGTWIVKRWEDASGDQHKGSLLISDRDNQTNLRGLFTIVTPSGRTVEQEMTITLDGEKIHMEGEVTKGTMYWSRDVLDFTLEGSVMRGRGVSDLGPATENIVLERALQSEVRTPNKEMQPTQ